MSHDRLSATDASFLYIETPHEPQHVGSLSYLEGAPLRDATGRVRIDELRSFLESRLHRVPRLRQRLQFVPLALGRPVWVDDDHFDIDYHVRLTALPRPGDQQQMHDLMGRLQSIPLDRGRPLWEMWFVDGLEGDQVGLVIKSHHALGDGIANVDLVLALVDLEREPPDDDPAPAWRAAPSPSTVSLVADSVIDQVIRPAHLLRAAARAVREPGKAVAVAANAAGTLAQFAGSPSPAPWNVPVTGHRRWASATVPLEVAREVRSRHQATINDVVLEVCAGALREFLLTRGESVEHTLKAMVPVSRRGEAEHGATLGNKVSLIVVDLPVDESDPTVRLERIHEQASVLKGSGLADGAETLVSMAGELTMLAGPLARLISRSIPMNLVITNIPGPPVPLYVRGARVLRAFPYVEVIDNEGLTIAVLSYDGQLHFGLTADRDVMPDLDLLAEAIEKAAAELVTASRPA
jgi:diacylglycerol O-acyltransferase / wax synthase